VPWQKNERWSAENGNLMGHEVSWNPKLYKQLNSLVEGQRRGWIKYFLKSFAKRGKVIVISDPYSLECGCSPWLGSGSAGAGDPTSVARAGVGWGKMWTRTTACGRTGSTRFLGPPCTGPSSARLPTSSQHPRKWTLSWSWERLASWSWTGRRSVSHRAEQTLIWTGPPQEGLCSR